MVDPSAPPAEQVFQEPPGGLARSQGNSHTSNVYSAQRIHFPQNCPPADVPHMGASVSEYLLLSMADPIAPHAEQVLQEPLGALA